MTAGPCPKCNSLNVYSRLDREIWYLRCRTCWHPWRRTEESASAAAQVVELSKTEELEAVAESSS